MNISSVGASYSAYSGAYGASSAKRPEGGFEDKLAELDADGDGALSLEESGLSEEQFAAMDTDGDGLLTSADKPEGPPPGQGPPPGGGMPPMDATEIIEAEDTDGDGQLSAEESSASSEQFDELDTNQDGFVSQAELEAAMAEMQQQMAQEMQAGGGSYGMNAYRAQSDMTGMLGAGYGVNSLGASLNIAV